MSLHLDQSNGYVVFYDTTESKHNRFYAGDSFLAHPGALGFSPQKIEELASKLV